MPEFTDQQFDADVARRLKFSTLVTPCQQQNAREMLLHRAAEQVILPPLETIADHPSLRTHVQTLRLRTLRIFNFLVMDSSAYERVRRPFGIYEYCTANGRYALAVIRLSA